MTVTASTGSGFLNNPPRTLLIANDNFPGSYPVEINPQAVSQNLKFLETKPFADTDTIETPVVYGQSKLTVRGLPDVNETISLTNADGNVSTFKFVFNPTSFVLSTNTYAVNIDNVKVIRQDPNSFLRPDDQTRQNVTNRLVTAINQATGSFITASPGENYDQIILTQTKPGTIGNTVNSTTTSKIDLTNFSGGNSSQIKYPYGIPTSQKFNSGTVVSRILKSARTGSLDVVASGHSSIINAPSQGHPWCNCTPFDETNAYQSFGIDTGGSIEYGTQGSSNDDFFTRGSVSGSFDNR